MAEELEGYLLSEDDRRAVQQLIDDARRRGERGGSGRGESQDVTFTPEVYVALTPEGGVPALVGDTPGSAECYVYRLVGWNNPSAATLERLGSQFRVVYNLSDSAVGAGLWVLVVRDKLGQWYLAQGGGGDSTFLAVLTDKEDEGPFLAYSWRRVIEIEGDEMTGYELVPADDGTLTGTGTGTCGTHDGVTSGGPGCWPAYHEQNIDLVVYPLLDEQFTGTGTAPDDHYIPPECVVRLRRGRGEWFLIDHEPRWELVVKDTDQDGLQGPNGVTYYPGWLLSYDQSAKGFYVKQDIFIIDTTTFTP